MAGWEWAGGPGPCPQWLSCEFLCQRHGWGFQWSSLQEKKTAHDSLSGENTQSTRHGRGSLTVLPNAGYCERKTDSLIQTVCQKFRHQTSLSKDHWLTGKEVDRRGSSGANGNLVPGGTSDHLDPGLPFSHLSPVPSTSPALVAWAVSKYS